MDRGVTRPRALLVDLDNTLYDWVSYFAPALRGMCTTISEMSGVPLSTVYADLRTVFVAHQTVEYSFAIQEMRCLLERHPSDPPEAIVRRYWPAIEVFQSRRRRFLQLYPGVREGLEQLRCLGVAIIAVTDGREYHAVQRLRQLRCIDLFDAICAVPDHASASERELRAIRRFQDSTYDTQLEKAIRPPGGVRKPNPRVLWTVLEEMRLRPDEAVYVGDSLMKDIAMAQQVGVVDCWAKYGTYHGMTDFHTLLRVTHWSAEAIDAAVNHTPEYLGIQPSHVADSFDDVVATVTTRIEGRGLHLSSPAMEYVGLASPAAGTARLGSRRDRM